MIKGCSKKVIVLKDTGSDFFEEAYFILKPQKAASLKHKSESDFVAAANKIISSKIISDFDKKSEDLSFSQSFPDKRKKKDREGIKRDLQMFLVGVLLSTCGAAILYLTLLG